jgi:hypothetical protein
MPNACNIGGHWSRRLAGAFHKTAAREHSTAISNPDHQPDHQQFDLRTAGVRWRRTPKNQQAQHGGTGLALHDVCSAGASDSDGRCSARNGVNFVSSA